MPWPAGARRRGRGRDAVEGDCVVVAGGARGHRGGGQPGAELLGGDVVGVDGVDETEVVQSPRAHELLLPGPDARHDEGGHLLREDLADRVVAAHGHDGLGAADEVEGVGDEVAHEQVVALGGDRGEPAAQRGLHVGAGDDDAGVPVGVAGPGEGEGGVVAVLPAADHAQHVGPGDRTPPRLVPRGEQPLPAPLGEVAGVADLGGDGARQVVVGDDVDDRPVAVDPDLGVVVADRLGRARLAPFTDRGQRVVEDVTQAEDDPRALPRRVAAHVVQRRERLLELTVETTGHLVDDDDVGGEGHERRGDEVGAQGEHGGQVHGEGSCGVPPFAVLGHGRDGDDLGVGRQRQRRRLWGTGEDEDVRARFGRHHGGGEGEVAPDVSQSLGVVGVEGDAAPGCRGHADNSGCPS